MNFRMSLRTKSILVIAVLIIGVATILSFSFLRQQENIIQQALRQRGEALASNLAFNAEFGVLTSNEEILNNLLVGVMQQPDVSYAIIVNEEGRRIAAQGVSQELSNSSVFAQVTDKAAVVEDTAIQEFRLRSGDEFYDISEPILTEEVQAYSDERGLFGEESIFETERENVIAGPEGVIKIIGHVRIGLSLANSKILIRQSQRTVMFLTIGIVLAAGLLTMILTGIAVRPIRKLVEGTRKIAVGDLNFRVSVKEGDEIGLLAASFNKMTADLKRSRDELIKAKEYTDNIIRSMIDILVVVDPKGAIRTVNPAISRVLGYAQEDLIGEPVDLILAVEGSTLSPRVDITKHLMKKGFITGYEMKLRRKDGTMIPVIFSGSLMIDSDGEMQGIVGIAKDITDRKKFEEALRESNERFNTLATNMPGMIYQFVLRPDESSYFPYVSPGCKELFGHEPEELMEDASLVLNMIHPEDREDFDKSVSRSAKTLEPWQWEGRFVKDGETRWVQGASRPKKQEDGSILWDGVIMDISERKVAESLLELRTKMLEKVNKELMENEKTLKGTIADLNNANEELRKAHEELELTQKELFESEKLKIIGRLASGVAHEVKNPLAIILQGITYVSKRIEKDDEAIRGVVEDINAAVRRADSVIKGVLDFASLTELDRESILIQDVVEASLLLVKHELDQNRVELDKNYQQDIPQVKVDKIKMEQVFVNLILNSVQAMEKGGKITLNTYARKVGKNDPGVAPTDQGTFNAGDEVVFVEIEDTGTGVPQEAMDKIFEPFYTTKGATGGTGLGLSIIKNIVDLHSGEIMIENRKEGGARTTVMLKV